MINDYSEAPNMVPVLGLNNGNYACIDLETGSVLGTNIAIVRMPKDATPLFAEPLQSQQYGIAHGIDLYVYPSALKEMEEEREKEEEWTPFRESEGW